MKAQQLLAAFFVAVMQFAHASSADLAKDISVIRATPLVKGELETTPEFERRKAELFAKFSAKTYKIVVDLRNLPDPKYKPFTYDADKSELTISLPELDKKLIWALKDGSRKIGFLNYSFLQTEPQVIKSDSYIGKNGLGTQIKVERHAVSTVGVAILGSENKHMIPQRFSIPFPRERVRELYAKGRVFLELKSDIQDLEEKPSLLLIDESETEPKMQRPIHVLRVKYMLPVRMVSISVLDEGGKQVFQSEGTEQTTNAVDSR